LANLWRLSPFAKRFWHILEALETDVIAFEKTLLDRRNDDKGKLAHGHA
jgi:hypothetical protein